MGKQHTFPLPIPQQRLTYACHVHTNKHSHVLEAPQSKKESAVKGPCSNWGAHHDVNECMSGELQALLSCFAMLTTHRHARRANYFHVSSVLLP